MGFGDALKGNSSKSQSTQTRASSSSSSSSGVSRTGLSVPSGTNPGDFPVKTRASPQYVVTEVDGEFGFLSNVEVPEVVMEKSWYSANWEYEDKQPGEWKRVWWTKQAFRRTAYIVEQESDENLLKVLADNPEYADELITECCRSYDTDQSISKHRTCAVCGEELHIRYDDIREVQKQPVCSEHTMEEVDEAGLL